MRVKYIEKKCTEWLSYVKSQVPSNKCNWNPTGLAGDKNNWQNNEQIVPKVIEYHAHTHPRSPVNIKEKGDEEKHRGSLWSKFWKPVIEILQGPQIKEHYSKGKMAIR